MLHIRATSYLPFAVPTTTIQLAMMMLAIEVSFLIAVGVYIFVKFVPKKKVIVPVDKEDGKSGKGFSRATGLHRNSKSSPLIVNIVVTVER